MPNTFFKTPVAFIIFNRPDSTQRVFDLIAKVRPSKLLVVADGPRQNRKGEAEKCALTRSIIDGVNWECEVITNYSDKNLGCKVRVSSGIDWVFEQVEEAIILEDDCLPDPSFFPFCQELLEHYRHDKRIGLITGDNFQFGQSRNEDSYYFSKYIHIWGWASWRDRWQGSYDVAMTKWPKVRDEQFIEDLVGNKKEAIFWKKIFDRVYRGKIDTWDYQWIFANWVEGRLTVIPNVNLISNIGFDQNATHTTGVSELANIPTLPMMFPLQHPIGVFNNIQADAYSAKKCFQVPLIKRIFNKVLGKLK